MHAQNDHLAQINIGRLVAPRDHQPDLWCMGRA